MSLEYYHIWNSNEAFWGVGKQRGEWVIKGRVIPLEAEMQGSGLSKKKKYPLMTARPQGQTLGSRRAPEGRKTKVHSGGP